MTQVYVRRNSASSLSNINSMGFKPMIGDYEQLVIVQRDENKSHSTRLGEAGLAAFQADPTTTIFPTPIVLRAYPKAGKQKQLIAAIKAGKSYMHLVEWCYAIDGQHRMLGSLRVIPEELHSNVKLDATVVVCDDHAAEQLFFAINGLGRRMAPAIIDLALAKQLIEGTLPRDVGHQTRAIATLLTRAFIDQSHPFTGLIELPLSIPPTTGAPIKFHKVVGAFKGFPSILIRESAKNDDDGELDVHYIQERVEVFAKRAAVIWKAIEFEIGDLVFDSDAKYAQVGERGWNMPHLFNILTCGIVNPMIIAPMSSKEFRSALEAPLKEFFEWGKTDEAMSQGFHNIGGTSGDAKYIDKLKELIGSKPGPTIVHRDAKSGVTSIF